MSTTTLSPHQIFAMAFLKVCNHYPYLQSIAYGLVRKESPGLGTVGVSGKGILYWDPEAVKKWTVKETAGVIVHELLHVIYDHNGRRDAIFAEAHKFNLAGDCTVNATIREMGSQLALPVDCLSLDSFDPPLPPGKTAEVYYWMLKERDQQTCLDCGEPLTKEQKNKQDKDKAGEPEADSANGASKPGDQTGPAAGQKGKGSKPDPNASGKGAGAGEHKCAGHPQAGHGWCGSGAGNKLPIEKDATEAEGKSSADFDLYRKMVAEAIRSEAKKGRGTIPNGMLVWADEMLAPAKIPWKSKLKRTVRNSVNYIKGMVDYTYTRTSRLQHSIGFGKNVPILPALHAPIPKVAIAIDTSGSMSSEELGIAVRESNGVLKKIGISAQFIASDCAVHTVSVVRNINDLLKQLRGGGGTSFSPVFEFILKQKIEARPDILIYITDGGGPVPNVTVPNLKTIWLLVGKGRVNPGFVGEVIELDD